MNTKEFLKREWAIWLLILGPLVFALWSWNKFPEQVPVHWNVKGEVDRWGGKASLFLSPLINLGAYLLLLLLPKIDPRKKNYNLFGGAYFTIRIALAGFLCMMGIVTMLYSLGWKLNVGMIVMYSTLVLFLLIGNQFGRIRPNYFVGLRTPWTLNNETVWIKTHRFAGRLWVIATLVVMGLIWFMPMHFAVFLYIAYVVVIVAIPVFYSWKIHKDENGNGEKEQHIHTL